MRPEKGSLIQPSGNALGTEDASRKHMRPEKGSLIQPSGNALGTDDAPGKHVRPEGAAYFSPVATPWETGYTRETRAH